MYASLVFWEETHRAWIISVIAIALWIASYYVYLRGDIRQFIKRRQAARWSVDMATKTITAGRKPVE